MNDNDDVMSFSDEPDINPSDFEPDVNSIPEKSENAQGTPSNAAESVSSENQNDYSGYEGFEAMSESESISGDLNGNAYSEKSDTESVEEESQAKKILDTKPSEKDSASASDKNKNKALFLNRSRLLLIIAGIFVLFILFFTFVFPAITAKKEKKANNELDKNGKTYIPSVLSNDDESPKNNFEDGNSALNHKEEPPEIFNENLEEKYPPLVHEQPKNVAPVSVSSSPAASSSVPLTNRNEQQKQPQRLALEQISSPVQAQNQNNGAYYPTVKPQGYSTNYTTGTGTQSSSSYMPQSLTSNIEKFIASQSGGNIASSYVQQNNQSAKQEFLNKNGIGGQFQWNAEYSLWKGSIISAVLDTGINTDLPGQIMAHVSKNVYSSQDGKYLLIPQGSRLFGEYSSDVSYGQNRIQVIWNTLIRPDGLEVNLGSMNGIDAYGISGYRGWKSEHPFEYVKAFGLIAMYSILDTKAMNTIDTANNSYAQNALTDVYSETKKLNNKIVDRALDIQPTITIKSGTEINLITNVTIDLPPLEPYEAEEKYVRY